jgi:UDP-galactopyranose mutase
MYDVIIVGAGLSGAVFADCFARECGKRVLVIDKRNHIAGNCYDYKNQDGQLVSAYGLHLFHCNDERTFSYIQRFGKWMRYDHKVVSRVVQDGTERFVPVPVSIDTVNVLCDKHLQTEEDMKSWLEVNQVKYPNGVKNGEEAAKARVGEDLYHRLFESYTIKQWDKHPSELDKSVLERIPVRTNRDTRYFSDKYQVLPVNGYTAFVQAMLDHPLITVRLETDFNEIRDEPWATQREWLIYTGPIDVYFPNMQKLEYRSIRFESERLPTQYYQTNVVVNEPDPSVPYTRTVEYKHLPYACHRNHSPFTTIVREYTTDTGEPFYPVPNQRNQELYNEYLELARKEEKNGVIFVGRLANYKYKNMNEAILDALLLFEQRVLNVNTK